MNEEGGVDTLYDHIVSEDSVIFTDGGSAISASVGLMCHGNGHVLAFSRRHLKNGYTIATPLRGRNYSNLMHETVLVYSS